MSAVAALVAVLGTAKVVIPAVLIAWKALTTAFESNPIGATVTLVTTLVAGLAAAVSASKAHAEAQMVETNAAKSLNEELEEQAKSYEEIKAKNKEAATNTKALANSVIDLAKSAATSQLDHEALLDTIDQLNEAVPNLNLAYDEQTGTLNQTTEAILAQVDAQNKQAEADAEIAQYTALREDRKAIELQMEEATNAVTEAQNKGDQETSSPCRRRHLHSYLLKDASPFFEG